MDRPPLAGQNNLRAVAVAVSAAVTTIFPMFLIGALAVPIRDDLVFGDSGHGALFALFSIAAAAASPIAGRLTARVGARRAIAAACAVSALAAGVLAAAATRWIHLAVLMAALGISNGAVQPGAHTVLARHTPLERQGFAFGLKQSAVPVASMLAGLLAPLAALFWGWRAFFAAAALASACLAWSSTRIVPDEGGHRGRPATDGVAVTPLLLLSVAAFFGGAAVGPLSAFIVVSGVERGFSVEAAGLVLALLSAAAVVARLLIGWNADRRGRGHLTGVALLLFTGAGGLLLLERSSSTVLFTMGAVVAGAAGWGWNGLFHYAVVDLQRQSPAVATSITLSGVFLGAGVGPYVFGALAEARSYDVAWLVAAALFALAGGLMLAGSRLFGRLAADASHHPP